MTALLLSIGTALVGAWIAWLWSQNRMLLKQSPSQVEVEARMREQFENLSQRLLDQTQVKIEKQYDQLLSPLKERLQEFTKRVEDSYGHEAKERHTLKHEIARLVELNQKVSTDAHNLTQALKGDSKIQGEWGEVQLKLILERSGLREGEEYTSQGRDLGLTDSDGARFKPDVIVRLPDKKQIIIDSKVSLTSYQRWVQSQDEASRKEQIRQHVASLRVHVDQLSGKNYQHLIQLDTPDLVLLFMPIEPALSEAMRADPNLLTYAWEKNIVIVSPTLLFTFLRTIHSLWVRQRQEENALKIAEEGGKLYDKFVGLIEDLEQVSRSMHQTQDGLAQALSKLRDGKGNLLGRVEKLRELGAKTKKQLSI